MCGTDPQDSSGATHSTGPRSADEERSDSAQDSAGEGGHMSSERGRIVQTPETDLPYKVILTHDVGQDTEHAFATMREAEAFIKRNTPVPAARRTTYDRDASAPVEHGD
jgi:hypothetical protein